jgi:uncharacterized membrane protein YraQ (UPF0718 family)
MNHLLDLTLCLAALLLGPVVYQISAAKRSTYAFFDGFVLVGVGGLVLFEILPRAFTSLGFGMVPVAIFGFLFPHFLEHRLNSLPISPRTILSTIIILGLVIHQILDGAALNEPGPENAMQAISTLGVAVILHQVPKGFLLWEISRKASGVFAAILVIAGLLAATTAGFLLGGQILSLIESRWVVYFQSFVAGGLLHVVVHHVSGGAEGQPRSGLAFASGAGALAACGILAWMPHGHLLEAPGDEALRFRTAFIDLALESAPPILLGFAAAGLLQACVSLKSLRWFHGGNRISSALRGVLFGVPLPICSCGVVPVYHTLIRRGVPAAAAVAFLIATPEIGLDSFFLSLGLLGLEITLIRLAMAFIVAFLSSCILSDLYSRVLPVSGEPEETLTDGDSTRGLARKLRRAFQFGYVELVDHLGVWIVVGLVVAAVIAALTEPGSAQSDALSSWLASLPFGADVMVLALAGLPIYVCASGATPLAAVLLWKGVSPGAVLAFLITGPTTNVTTFGILAKLHGKWRAAALPAAVLAISVAIGIGINFLIPPGSAQPPAILGHPHTTLEIVSTVLLALLLGISILRMGPRRFLGKLGGELGVAHSHSHGTDEHEPACDADAHGHEHSHAAEKGCGCEEP